MIKKNDILDLTIEDLGVNGEGIGKVDGYTLFNRRQSYSKGYEG